jgi:enamine deaminase RidA (YjgF/YER057c/UK114 family)
LAALGLALPAVPVPAGAYLPAVRHDDLVFTAGQLPFTDGRLAATGRVGADVEPAAAAALARTCALNAVAAAAAAAGSVDALSGVVKVTGFVASAPGFGGQPGVLDGASTLLFEIFGEAGRHARSAVGVAELPLGSPVEVEVVFALSGP